MSSVSFFILENSNRLTLFFPTYKTIISPPRQSTSGRKCAGRRQQINGQHFRAGPSRPPPEVLSPPPAPSPATSHAVVNSAPARKEAGATGKIPHTQNEDMKNVFRSESGSSGDSIPSPIAQSPFYQLLSYQKSHSYLRG
ncbi:hypothetical protein EVAR_97445_1 [Eumeta japonica]|uniref:Uncharacterized protein n=1 Tax=Eumeta variegata TaxID=151549 RepID=A0A4C1X0Z1_EUMVA|nr:hypothetical protein EVAR_97445_1 [Eumeta japonica]